MNNVVEIKNHLIKHKLGILRDKKTKPEQFRNALRRVGYFLIYEACRDLNIEDVTVETPLVKTSLKKIDKKVKLIAAPILRAGLGYTNTPPLDNNCSLMALAAPTLPDCKTSFVV